MPLGMARASEYAEWWLQSNNISVTIPVTSSVSQTVYQTPSFSFNDTAQYNTNGIRLDCPVSSPTGQFNLSGYSSLTGFGNFKYTHILTCAINWASGLTTNATYAQYEIKANNNGTNYYDSLRFNIASDNRLDIQLDLNNSQSCYLPGNYTDWNNVFITIVMSGSTSSSDYTNWAGSGTDSYYRRIAVYNTATGELINKIDTASAYQGMPNVGDWLTNSSSVIDFADFGGNYSTRWRNVGPGYVSANAQPVREAGLWFAWGTMFDPVAVKSTDSTWLTTRPNKTIGTGVAWLNAQYCDYVQEANGSNYDCLTKAVSGVDYYSRTGNGQVAMTYNTSLTNFTNNYSTTYIPKDSS